MASGLPSSALSASSGSSLEPHLGSLSPKVAAALVREHIDPTGMREFARSSPAKLLAVAVLLVLVCITAGAVAASTASDRQSTLDHVLDQTEPFSASAQRLFSALSVADAAASTAFISGGIEPQAVRDRYTQAIGEASAELAGGAAGSESADAPARKLLSGIATQLPVYTGLVETARANNRNGLPVGAAYLGEASTLMQTKTLPMAEKLHAHQSAAVAATQHRYVRPPWLAISLLVLALICLVLAQIYLLKRWRRVFNPGLILATIAMTAAFAWLVIAGIISAVATDRALHHGTEPLATLTQARILAQQARSEETLQLVRRDTTGAYDRAYASQMQDLDKLLAGYGSKTEGSDHVSDARTARNGWSAAHGRMNATLAGGDFDGASAVAVGPGAADSLAQFTALDGSITDGIAQARGELRSEVARASNVLNVLAPAALALSVLAAVFVMIGLWPRLREYR